MRAPPGPAGFCGSPHPIRVTKSSPIATSINNRDMVAPAAFRRRTTQLSSGGGLGDYKGRKPVWPLPSPAASCSAAWAWTIPASVSARREQHPATPDETQAKSAVGLGVAEATSRSMGSLVATHTHLGPNVNSWSLCRCRRTTQLRGGRGLRDYKGKKPVRPLPSPAASGSAAALLCSPTIPNPQASADTLQLSVTLSVETFRQASACDPPGKRLKDRGRRTPKFTCCGW